MSNLLKLNKITESDMKDKTISSLSDRANQLSRFGHGSTSQELKKRFDAFSTLSKNKINAVIQMLASKDATKYFRTPLQGADSIYDFLSLFGEKTSEEKSIADFIYWMYSANSKEDPQSLSLNEMFAQIAKDIAELKATFEEYRPPEGGGGDDGGETPPPEGGDDGGETPPPDDGGDDGGDEGGTTPTPPPEGGDEGGDEGGTTPTPPPEGGGDEDGDLEEVMETITYFEVEEAIVPNNALSSARVVYLGSNIDKFSANYIYPFNSFTLTPDKKSKSIYIYPPTGRVYCVACTCKSALSNPISFNAYNFKNVKLTISNLTHAVSGTTHEYSFSVYLPLGSNRCLIFVSTTSTSEDVLVNNIIFYPIERGERKSSDLYEIGTYENSAPIIAKCGEGKSASIPASVASDDFGIGFGDYFNRYCFEEKQYEKKVKVVSGSSLSWSTQMINQQYYAYAALPYKCIDHAVESSPYDPCVFTGTEREFGVDVASVNGASYIVVSRGESMYNSVDSEFAEYATFFVALETPEIITVETEEDGIIDVASDEKIYLYDSDGSTKRDGNFAVRYVLSEEEV